MSRGGYGYWGVAEEASRRGLGGTGFDCFGETARGIPDRSYGVGFIAQSSPHILETRET